ncbi:MAG: hypothetical protein JWN36_822 [Microbacteriaceae bacterium]|nr:hypothetical protein [Microbacteriaceae bacterium]
MKLRAWLALLGVSAGLRAESVLSVPTVTGADVSIKVGLVPAQPPRFGFAPIRVTIENSAPQERSWQLQFQAGTRGQFPGMTSYERLITVPAGQTRDTWVYVPIAEPGTPGGEPTLSAVGIVAPPPTAPRTGSPVVSITRTFTGTRVIRTMSSSVSGAPIFTEETNIDSTTGELTATTTTGTSTSSRSSKPPAGVTVTYRIDSATGSVGSSYSGMGGSGPTKVLIITDPARGGSPASTPKVTIEPTPVGMRVTRVIGIGGPTGQLTGPGRSYTEEREIDGQTGVITSTMVSPSGTPQAPRSTAPLNPGTETTFTINPTTGTISTRTRNAANTSAPPKITIVTGPAGGTILPPRTASGSTPSSRIVPSSYSGPPMNLSVEVNGPGFAPGSNRANFSGLGSTANMRPVAATLALERVLRESLNNEGIRTPNLAVVEPAQLPADWRMWSSFVSVFMQADEYATLDAAHRAALRGWVALGGQLYLTPADAGSRSTEALGAGSIITLASPLKSAPTVAELIQNEISLGGTPGHPDTEALTLKATSGVGEVVAEQETSATWLTVFLIFFAAVIGPVNLYVFAPAAKRHRLFVTTPLISLVGAGILALTIVGQDGAGGEGLRRALVVLIPGDNQAAVFQEQAARTGFLTSQSFALPGDVQLTALPLEDAVAARLSFNNTSELNRDDTRASGNWFRSRGRQGHLLQRLVPTRGRVERVGTGRDGAPIVQSSLAGSLRDFVCADEKGDLWSARELTPGRRVTLERGGKWPGSLMLGGTKRFGQILAAATPTTGGHWGAKGGDGELAPLATLGAVRWKPLEVIYAGVLEGTAVEVTEAKR